MLFSFLVPVYNTEKYLKQCVESLLAQKGADFEIILLDDGSTDSSPRICDDFRDAYPGIVRVIHKENEGLLLTRRRGFAEAKGAWFICVDSDDYVAPNLLERVAHTACESGADMVMYNFAYLYDNGTQAPSRLRLEDGAVFERTGKQHIYEQRMLSVDVNMMWMRAIKREIVDIDTDYRDCGLRNMCEDAVQVLPLYTNAQKIVYIDKPLYYYRKSDASITGRTTLANWKAIHRSFVLEQSYAEKWQISEEVSRKRYTRQMENICNCVRWLYNHADVQEIPEVIQSMKEESMFREYLAQYDTKYAASRYSAVSMPIISRAVDRQWYGFLKCYFRLENKLRGK